MNALSRNARARDVRALTLSPRRISLRLLLERGTAEPTPEHARPRTRGDCAHEPRPCPFVSCRYHLYLDVQPNGSVKLNFPDLEPEEMPVSCALDVAERGGATLNEVADAMNLTRERVRQILKVALERPKLRQLRKENP